MDRCKRANLLRGLVRLLALSVLLCSGVLHGELHAANLLSVKADTRSTPRHQARPAKPGYQLAAALPDKAEAKLAPQPVEAQSYEWWSRREGKRIKLRGFVPSEEHRKTIHGMIKANMPELEVDDRLQVAPADALSQETWLGAVSFALVQLSQLKVGVAQVKDMKFYLEGEARTAAAYAAIRASVATHLPHGVTLKEVVVTPPAVTPFVWMVRHEGETLTFAGHVPSEDLRRQLVLRASHLFGTTKIIDHMELAAGAPDNWRDATAAALEQLARLKTGTVSLRDTELAIEGLAETKAIADDVAAVLRQSLPESYAATNRIRYRLGRAHQPRKLVLGHEPA